MSNSDSVARSTDFVSDANLDRLANQLLHASESIPQEVCQWCQGYGFYTVRVPVKHEWFGKAFTCGCKPGGHFPGPDAHPSDEAPPESTGPALPASPVKLGDGSWGVKIDSDTCQVGQTVLVTTKKGKEWTAIIDSVHGIEEGKIIATATEAP